MRELYQSTYKQGRGFTRDEFWGAVTRAAGGRSFAEFDAKYIDGREPFPWTQILPLAGLQGVETRLPRIGVRTTQDPRGVRVTDVDTAAVAGAAGVRPGDYLLAVDDIAVTDPEFGPKLQVALADARDGQPVKILVMRGAQTLTLTGGLRLVAGPLRIALDPAASPKAVRIRDGILRGTTDR